jgi:hypothetical protein
MASDVLPVSASPKIKETVPVGNPPPNNLSSEIQPVGIRSCNV